MYFNGTHQNLMKMDKKTKTETILERSRSRQSFYEKALKMFAVCDMNGLRLIVENPFSTQHFLVENFPYKASIIDRNRAMRGDYFNKPTQYWFVNCDPTTGFTEQRDKEVRRIKDAKKGARAGLCSEDRSMISPDYARNFICDFILAKRQKGSQLYLFEPNNY